MAMGILLLLFSCAQANNKTKKAGFCLKYQGGVKGGIRGGVLGWLQLVKKNETRFGSAGQSK
jgi:hypothetical protein